MAKKCLGGDEEMIIVVDIGSEDERFQGRNNGLASESVNIHSNEWINNE